MEDVNQDHDDMNEGGDFNPLQDMKRERAPSREKTHPIRCEKLEMVISLPQEFILLLEKLTCGDQEARDKLFTEFVIGRMWDIKDESLDILRYTKGIDEAFESTKKGLNHYHGREKYVHDGKHFEKQVTGWQELVPLEATLTLPVLLIESLERFNTIAHLTREQLCACFIIEQLENIVSSPELFLDYARGWKGWRETLKAGLHQYFERMDSEEKDDVRRM